MGAHFEINPEIGIGKISHVPASDGFSSKIKEVDYTHSRFSNFGQFDAMYASHNAFHMDTNQPDLTQNQMLNYKNVGQSLNLNARLAISTHNKEFSFIFAFKI